MRISSLLLATLSATALAAGCASAHPHPAKPVIAVSGSTAGWYLNANRCPDLIEDRADRREDRRDARVITGVRDLREDRRDRAENRRDEAVLNCPASAWTWTGTTYSKSYHPARPAATRIYYNPTKRQYYRRVGGKTVIVKL